MLPFPPNPESSLDSSVIEALLETRDLSSTSASLTQRISTPAMERTFHPQNTALLRPFKWKSIKSVLVIGAGWGEMPRFLG